MDPGPDSPADPPAEPAGLERALGLFQITASGVGIIVGAGIYVLIGAATDLAGSRVWLGFLLAAVLSALTGLSYAELSSMFPKAGAEFEYARHAYPPWVAFLVGWVMFAGLMVAAAAVALGFGRYLGRFVGLTPTAGGLVLLAAVTAVALTGIRRSAVLTTLLSIVQVGGLLYVVTIGLPHLGQADLLGGDGRGWGGVVSAAALVFFAFIGFDEVITLAEEAKDPTRTVPRALLIALGLSSALYMAVAVAAVSVVGAASLAASERPLVDVIDHALGGRGADVVAVFALTATANTTLLCVTAASRLQYGMAVAGALPAPLARVGRRSRAPWVAVLVAGAVAAAFATIGDLAFVASVTDLAVYLVFLAVNGAVLVLRRRRPDAARPFRAPGQVRGVPVTPVLGLLAVLVMIPALDGRALVVGALLCAAGLAAGGLISRARSSPAPRRR